MKITSIKQQLKRTDRYSIYIEDKYSFSLSEAALLRSGLASGQELTVAEVENYKQLSSDDKVYNRALRYVAMRPRAVWELKTYLQRHQASEPLIQETISKLEALGLLDDGAYAASFVRDRQLLRPSSRRRLILELKKKHIAEEYINTALAEQEFNDTDSLAALVIKKRRQTKYQDNTKLMQYLARQGFGYGDIKRALGTDTYD